ncbi:hypothetical protein ACFQ07_33675, partial [Actinomadura adrarensis]
MSTGKPTGAHLLRRLRMSRGWSWDQLAQQLRDLARDLRFARIGTNSLTSIKRNIARWEAGSIIPGHQYQLLLAHTYARTPSGTVALGPGSDFHQLLDALADLGVDQTRLDELNTTVTATATDTGMNLLAFLSSPFRTELARALARPKSLDTPIVNGLRAATDAINQQIGSVPFVRLHLAQSAIVDACRQLLDSDQPEPLRSRLRQTSSAA